MSSQCYCRVPDNVIANCDVIRMGRHINNSEA